jgi:hypothetical protein
MFGKQSGGGEPDAALGGGSGDDGGPGFQKHGGYLDFPVREFYR